MAIGSTGMVPISSVTETDNLGLRETEALMYKESNAEQESLEKQGLVSYIEKRFQRAKDARYNDEQRWLQCYRNFRGVYGPEVAFSSREKNKSFIKITKTKVMAAYNKVVDVLFAGNKFPIGVESTPVPEGIADKVYIDPEEEKSKPQNAPTATIARPDIVALLGNSNLKTLLDPVKDKVKEGAGTTPTSMTWEPAKIAARKMEKKFNDQLAETNADKTLRKFAFELSLFGTGVYKGPMLWDKEYPKWTAEGVYEPEFKKTADFTDVSIWDAYPDPQARFTDEMEDFIQRHQLSKTELRKLKKRPGFREDSIELAIDAGADYERMYWEDQLRDYKTEVTNERWEVLEFWGIIDKQIAEEADLEIPEEYEDEDQINVNVWICNGKLLRLVFNSFTPARIPYYIVPFEINPYSIFGVGVAENMQDTQLLMNGAIRGMVDNAILSSNVVLEVNEQALVQGQDMELYPGKIFRTEGQLGQAIHSIDIKSTTQEHMTMFDKYRQLADEATGIPSYSHGQGGVQGVGRTAAGMSMLMGAAAENIKGVIRNIDDYLLIPMGKALFAFNMQFDFDKEFIGDLDIVARGTESLMRNEVRSQKLLQFLQVTGTPMDAPWVKRDYILRELAESMDLEADLVVNDSRTAGIQAMIMKEMMLAQGIDPSGAQPQGGNPSGAPSVNDPTQQGGGNITPGASPEPGSQGFSGTPRA